MKESVLVFVALILSFAIISGLWCHSNAINRRLDRIADALERAYPVQAESK